MKTLPLLLLRAENFRPQLGAYGILAGRDLYRATAAIHGFVVI